MILPSGTTIYTFDGIAFYRQVEAAGFQPWFAVRVEYTRDQVLESDTDYLDIGATTNEPLEIRAYVFSRLEADALSAKIGVTAVLTNTAGRSQDATLISAVQEKQAGPGRFVVILTFVRRPTGST